MVAPLLSAKATSDYGSTSVSRITPEQLCAEYATKVARFASLAAGTDGDADDIAQDALIKAIAALDRFDPERGSLDAWLWRIVANTARDSMRRAHVRAAFAERFASDLPFTDPEVAAIDRATSAEIYAAMARLNARDRELLALRFGSDLSTAEVGGVVGLSAESARRAIGRALDRLRAKLAGGAS
jgi:RNA polymerase sigma-70 factor (ECF subfamily)